MILNLHTRLLICYSEPQAAQTLFVIYIRDSIALRCVSFKRMYENGPKIALNSTYGKRLNRRNGFRTALERLSCLQDFKITQAQSKVSFFY